MDARPDSIVEFFNAERQLMVPLFQRPYEWTEKHWSVLWDDLLERYEQGSDSKNTPHFTGAIVTSTEYFIHGEVFPYEPFDVWHKREVRFDLANANISGAVGLQPVSSKQK